MLDEVLAVIAVWPLTSRPLCLHSLLASLYARVWCSLLAALCFHCFLCCLSPYSAVPGNILITAVAMRLGWQVTRASLLCWTGWNSSATQVKGTATCGRDHTGAQHSRAPVVADKPVPEQVLGCAYAQAAAGVRPKGLWPMDKRPCWNRRISKQLCPWICPCHSRYTLAHRQGSTWSKHNPKEL